MRRIRVLGEEVAVAAAGDDVDGARPYLAGPVADFDGFVASEYRRVLAVAFALTGDAHAAQDVTQEAFLVVMRKLRAHETVRNPVAYVRGVAANIARSRLRRRMAELRALTRLRSRPTPEMELPADSASFWAAVRGLPARQAVVAALFYADDLSVADIAACLGIAEGTVKAHLSRARASLSARLGLADEEDEDR